MGVKLVYKCKATDFDGTINKFTYMPYCDPNSRQWLGSDKTTCGFDKEVAVGKIDWKSTQRNLTTEDITEMNNNLVFKNLREAFVYMANGGTVVVSSNQRSTILYKFNDENNLMSKAPGKWWQYTTTFHPGDDGDFKKYVEPEWYDNIPAQGILCYVSDSDNYTNPTVRIVIRYDIVGKVCQTTWDDIGNKVFHTNCQTTWKHAKPLSAKDVETYLYKNLE
jgi:hypothetical protein